MASVRFAVSTMSLADWSRIVWSYASIRMRIRSLLIPDTRIPFPNDRRPESSSSRPHVMRESKNVMAVRARVNGSSTIFLFPGSPMGSRRSFGGRRRGRGTGFEERARNSRARTSHAKSIPGVDQYLEGQSYWPEFHLKLVNIECFCFGSSTIWGVAQGRFILGVGGGLPGSDDRRQRTYVEHL